MLCGRSSEVSSAGIHRAAIARLLDAQCVGWGSSLLIIPTVITCQQSTRQ
jgi:hypothetical protein